MTASSEPIECEPEEFMYTVTVAVQQHAATPREAAAETVDDLRTYLACGRMSMQVTNHETGETTTVDLEDLSSEEMCE